MPAGNTEQSEQYSVQRNLALAAAVISFLIFSGQFIISRHGILQGLTSHDITALRFLVAGLISAPFLIKWDIGNLGGIGWARGVALAIVAGAPYFALMIGGLSFAPAAHVVIINPGMTLLGGTFLSVVWLGEKRSILSIVAGIVALIGLFFVAGESVTTQSSDIWIGNLMFAVSGLMWAFYMALLNRWRINPIGAAIVVTLLSTIYLPLYWFMASPQFSDIPLNEILLQAGYQGIFHALIAMALFSYAVRILGVGPISLMTPIVPVAGLAMAAFFLGEELSQIQWFGAGLVCSAMLLTAREALRRTDAT